MGLIFNTTFVMPKVTILCGGMRQNTHLWPPKTACGGCRCLRELVPANPPDPWPGWGCPVWLLETPAGCGAWKGDAGYGTHTQAGGWRTDRLGGERGTGARG